MTGAAEKRGGFASMSWGPWVAMVAAVILTAKGEFDLAVLAHFDEKIAWMFPVMIDVYVITAFHRRRWKDMVIGMLLMIFCQIAVHLLPVYITAGEQTPWGLVVAVACIAPIVVVRVKMLTGRTAAEIAAEQDAARRADEVRAARAETAAVRQALAEIEARAAAAIRRAEAETAAREQAETRAAEAEAQVEAEAETRAEIAARLEAEIAARREAEKLAQAQAALARTAEGRLAEARDTAERAVAARALTEQAVTAELAQVRTEAIEAEERYRQQLADATAEARRVATQAAELAEQVRRVEAQRDEAQRVAERQTEARVLVEREIEPVRQARDAALNEVERVRRSLARAQERAEIGRSAAPEITRAPKRKSPPSVPVLDLPGGLPEVEKVRPETVALVLSARAGNPDATQAELSALTGISDRTIRTVLRAVPEEIAGQVGEQLLVLAGGPALALTDGRAA